MKESRLGKAERRSPTRAGPGPEAEAQPLPKPLRAGVGGRREPRHTQASSSVTQPVCVLKGGSVPSSEFCSG